MSPDEIREHIEASIVDLIKQKVEAGRGMLRQIRVDLKKNIDDQKNQPGVSEDDIHNGYDELQTLVDEFHGQLDKLEQSKTKELTSL